MSHEESDMSKKRSGSIQVTVQPSIASRIFSVFSTRDNTSTQPTCNCKSKKHHRGGRCLAPIPGRAAVGQCSWCAKGHPDHSYHDEHRHQPRREQRTQRHWSMGANFSMETSLWRGLHSFIFGSETHKANNTEHSRSLFIFFGLIPNFRHFVLIHAFSEEVNSVYFSLFQSKRVWGRYIIKPRIGMA